MLEDPRWQKTRLLILDRDNWRCTNCGDSKKTLHVHHKAYLPGHAPWEYSENNFLSLCHDCHLLAERSRFVLLSLLDSDEITQKLIVTGKAMTRTLFPVDDSPDGVPSMEEDPSYYEAPDPEELEAFFAGMKDLLEDAP